MKIRNILLILLFGLLASCNSEEGEKTEEPGILSKSWTTVKSTVNLPFEYFEERSRKADSTEIATIANHYKTLRNLYPEYSAAEKWFKSQPPELLGLEGDFYKITEGTIQVGRSISRSHFVEPTNGNIYLYFFRSKERFFILELEVNNQVTSKSVRCIMDGWGKQPMFDYLYDENGNLIQEVFQADVKPSFYEDDGYVYFKYSNNEIINTIVLGPTIN